MALIIPTAKDLARKSAENWPVLTLDQIFTRMDQESEKGERKATFYTAILSKEVGKKLKKGGYSFRRFTLDGVPCFTVRW